MVPTTTNDIENIHNVFNPSFFRLQKQSDNEAFKSLLLSNSFIQVFDKIESQLEELIKIKNPSVSFSAQELKDAIFAHIGTCEISSYGVWVHYPWSNRLVHLLDKEEFIAVRTSRNLYKITAEEQKTLSTKKVGVIGLSVGQSVSLTMAMERSFGEIRIADFDTIDTSNLNRIRTGVHNIGIKKTIITAREIAEIDPFMKVTCFHEGITNENLEDFYLTGGKIDALIEECDSINIKIKSRIKAKELGIPVIMDTSDREMLDIERFDLEPNRPIFHGFAEKFDLNNFEELSSFEKTNILHSILDTKQISERLRFSMSEIHKSITTWPQLASSVTTGGGLAAEVYRQIVLNAPIRSGRHYMDINKIIV